MSLIISSRRVHMWISITFPDELSNSSGEYPLDYDKLKANPADFTLVAAEANTGKTKYFTKDDLS